MRRLAVGAGLVMVVGVGGCGGCGGGGPPPINKAPAYKPATAGEPAITLPADPPPAASDPASKAVVAAALDAHTGGQPGKLDALRVARKTMAGTMVGLNAPITNECQFAWRWPDRTRINLQLAGHPPAHVRRVGAAAWISLNNQPEAAMGGPELDGIRAEGFAECLLVLFPLADPAAVLSPAAGRAVRGRPAAGVRVSGPGWPGAVCHFDADTKRLVQVSYRGYEGKPLVKEAVVLADEPVNGVTVPKSLKIVWDGEEKGGWTLVELVFPAAHDPKLFDGP